MCRVSNAHLSQHSGNAGCVIKINQQLLTITNRVGGTLDLPGGTAKAAETAQCTAHRETFEETGFNVEVGEHLGTNAAGFHFFACQVETEFAPEDTRFPVPAWSQTEVRSIQLVDPFVTEHRQWRFPDQLIPIRTMFNRL